MKSDNSVKVSMKVSDDRVEDIKQTTSRSSISPTDHGSGGVGMGRNSIEQVEFLTHKRSSVKQTLSRRSIGFHRGSFMTKTRGSFTTKTASAEDLEKALDPKHASDIASSIPTAATDAMKHLPKLIYGSNKVELDMFDGEDVPAQDADLSVSELTSSLRMIIKRMIDAVDPRSSSQKTAKQILLAIFMSFDKSNDDGQSDGQISFPEFSACMKQLFRIPFNQETLAELFMSMDTNLSGEISFQEFLAYFNYTSPISTLRLQAPDTITCVAFSRNGRYTAYGGMGFVAVIISGTGEVVFRKQLKTVQTIALSSLGNLLFVGGWFGSAVEVYELDILPNSGEAEAEAEAEAGTHADLDEEVADDMGDNMEPGIPKMAIKRAFAIEKKISESSAISQAASPIEESSKAVNALLFAKNVSRFKRITDRRVQVTRSKNKLKQDDQAAREASWVAQEPLRKFEMDGNTNSLAISKDDAYLIAGGNKKMVRLFNIENGDLLTEVCAPGDVTTSVDVDRTPWLCAVFDTKICGIQEKIFSQENLLTTHLSDDVTLVCLNLTGSRTLPRHLAASLVLGTRDLACDGKENRECSVLFGGFIERSLKASLSSEVMTVRLDARTAQVLRANPEQQIDLHAVPVEGTSNKSDLCITFDPNGEDIKCSGWAGEKITSLSAGARVVLSIRGKLCIHAYDNLIVCAGNYHSVILTTFRITCKRHDGLGRFVSNKQSQSSMKASKFEAGRSFAESDSKHSHTPGIAKFISSVTASIIMDSEGGENSETKSKEGKGIYQKFAGYLSDVHTFALEMGSSSSSDAVALHGRSKKMAIGNSEGQILLVSTTPHEEEIIQHFDFGESVSGVCLSSDGLKVAACGAVGSVIVFDILTGCQNFCHAAPSRLMDVVFGGMDANDSSCIAFGGHAKQFELVNYSEGQRMHAFPASADVQSVSLSADGTRMAIGKTDQNGPASCKIVQTATAKVYRKWTAADMKTIYSVDLSRSGRMVAYAGYGSVVWVRSVDADELLLEHRFTQLEGSEGPTFIWSVAFSGDESRFAASCWSGEVIIWSTKTWEPICTSIKRPGVRVFSIALARDGSEILVGSRDGNAILYGLPHDDDDRRDVVILFQAVFPDRVYSVAISDRYFALAGMNSSVHLYKRLNVAKIKKDDGSVSPRTDAPAEGAAAVPIGQSARHYHHHVHFRLVHEYYVHCDQNCVEFSPDGLSLAAGGTDKSVRLWSVGDDVLDNLSLFLHRKHAIHDLSFSDSYLAFACGHKACVYGTVDARLKAHMVARPNVWSHQPSFEVLADLLRSPEALRVVKKHHPQCLNVVSPATGESILQRCVRVHNHDVLASLLDGVRRVGFIRDNEGFTALDIALKWRKRKHVETLLQAVSSGRVSTLASSLAAVSESFPKLCKTFPRLFLDFISEMPLDHVHGMSVHFSESTVVLPKGIFASYARGTRLRSEPRNLWADILKLSDGGSGRSARARLEVQAMRVPFENFVGYYPNLHESPFHLVTKVAEDLDRFEVFESPIMRAAIQFKWEQYGMQQFLWQAIKFCLNLIVLILFSVQASRSMELEDCATLDWYFGRDPESCGGNYALKQSYILLPLSFLCNKMFLTNELDQIRELGLKAYTASIWNWIDTIGFGLALAGQVMWVFAREGVKFPNSTRMCLGLSCLLMAWKMLYFLRATDQGGNLVRIVISIMDDMKPYIILLFCFVLAFAMALLIINVEAQPYILIYNAYTSNWCNEPAFSDDDDMAFDPNMFITDDQLKMCSCPPEGCTTLFLLFEYVQFVVTAAVYGSSDLFVGMGTLPTRSNQVIYNLSLVTIQIILLNLVIAVMGGTYERVQAGKVKNTLYEKAAVIVEMELSHDTSLEGIVFRKVCGPIPDLLVAIATPFLNFFQRFTSSNGETIHPGDGGEETETEAQARSSSEVRAKHLADHYPRWLHTLQKKPGNDQSTMDGDSQESSLSSSTKNGGGSSGAENTLTADMMQASLEDMGCQIQELQEAMTKLTTKSAVEFNQLRDLIQTVVIQQHTAAGLQK